ncbi:MAG: endo alpha-1,4 polygalactosaminidase [Formivibrio sp.]|nr:endo alpha-1,4 polygalactosaminidase [Formivibrio sp.]
MPQQRNFTSLLITLLGAFFLLTTTALRAEPNSVAFYYGDTPPTEVLQAHDWAVVESQNLPSPPVGGNTQWFAYLSLGEVTADQSYAKDIPAAWKLGKNAAWNSWILDQRPAEWPDFVVNHIVAPMWDAGYRGFFLDTLDSWQSIAKNDAERKAQAEGLIRVIAAIKARYPEVKLIANRGFEIMPQIHSWLSAVAFESYLRGWDADKQRYQIVPESERNWLNEQLRPIRGQYHLPIIAIDYVSPVEHELAKTTATQLRAAGFIPWVADSHLASLGVGNLELQPRTVLIVYDRRETDQLIDTEIQFVAAALNYLGYSDRLLDVSDTLPVGSQQGKIAGIVSWLNSDNTPEVYQPWLREQIKAGIPWVALGRFGFRLTGPWQQLLKLKSSDRAALPQGIRTLKQSPLLGYETIVPPPDTEFQSLTADSANVLLDLQNNNGVRYQPAAITEWGGYALSPYVTNVLPDSSSRWIIDPIGFLSQALRLPAMPMPDTTTENGRRIMISHIDGDGFVSEAEIPGYPPAGEVMLKEILKKYSSVPITVSVIEGEVGPTGLYPTKSPQYEKIARQIFALPNVEIASHTYSHPFAWQNATNGETSEDYFLQIPGYTFNLEREIAGSAHYIDTRLAPPGKKTRILLWSGDCDPPEEAIRQTRAAGLLNMNGGDTVITKTLPSLTAVAPIGMFKGKELQIFAPNQNENVYTNDWIGPFYGYQRVIETFQMTETPRRIKPIDIYYHFYSATKPASLTALKHVYDWALAQPVIPMFSSDYIERAQGFFSMTISRHGENAFDIRNGGALRTLRLPLSAGYPDIAASQNVAGFYDHQGIRYIHLSSGEASLVLRPEKPTTPYLAYANAKLAGWSIRPNGLHFALNGWLPLKFALGQANGCRLSVDGKSMTGRSDGELTLYELPQHVASEIDLSCQR